MPHLLIKILPVISLFALGFLLKKIGIIQKNQAVWIIKFVFYVALPAIMFISVLHIDISLEMLYITIFPFIIMAVIGVISAITGKYLRLPVKDFGVFIVGTLIMNVGFTYPFIIAGYGEQGLAVISFFNFSNSLITFTIVYYLACRYGGGRTHWGNILKKFIFSLPLWALVAGVICNFLQIRLTDPAERIISMVGNLTVPLVLFSLGIYFTPGIVHPKPFTLMILIRQGLGFLIGLLLVYLFGISSFNAVIVLIGASAPVGYNTLVFSTMEGLNKEFAASVVSFSLLIGIIYIPLLMLIFPN